MKIRHLLLYICDMKKIVILFSFLFVALVTYAQEPLDSIGMVFGISQHDAQARLEAKGITFDTSKKDIIVIEQQVESAGSQFGKCRLIFKKDKLIEADFEQIYTKSEERIIPIKFSAISRALGEVYILRRYVEKTRDGGYYNGWRSTINGDYAMLKYEKQDDGSSRLNLIFSPKSLF